MAYNGNILGTVSAVTKHCNTNTTQAMFRSSLSDINPLGTGNSCRYKASSLASLCSSKTRSKKNNVIVLKMQIK